MQKIRRVRGIHPLQLLVIVGWSLISLFLVVKPARAEIITTFDSIGGGCNSGDLWINSTKVRAQAFTTGAQGGSVEELTLEDAYSNPFTSGYAVAIYSDNSGAIGSELVTFESSPTHPMWTRNLVFDNPSSAYVLQPSTTYWVYADMSYNNFYWNYENSAVTTGTIPGTGHRAYSADGSNFDYDGDVTSSVYGTGAWHYNFKLTLDTAGDAVAPTITNVTSDKANGSYTTDEVIDIDVTFSENVTSTGNVTVTLETGDTDRSCTFTVSSASSGTCNYTVQDGDTSADLTVKSISGTIADGASNAMTNFVPTTNLAANKAIVVDTTDPVISGVGVTPADNGVTVEWTSDEAGSSIIDYGLTNSVSSSTSEADTSPRVTDHSVEVTNLVACTSYYYRARSKDAASNTGASSVGTFTTTGCVGSASVNEESLSGEIATGAGGTASLTSGDEQVDLTIPSGYSGTAAYFQIKQLDATSVTNITSTPASYETVGNSIYDFKALTDTGTAVTSFNQAITVVLTYAAADVVGLDESSLWIYRWDGSAWQALTGCSVDTVAKTVTCTTTDFSTFGLFGTSPASSGGGGGSGDNSDSSCGAWYEIGVPDLFRIERWGTTAKLYFSPLMGNDKYWISYAENSWAEGHGGEVQLGTQGVQSYLVNYLKPGGIYYFKVRGQSSCEPGSWSKVVRATVGFGGEVKIDEVVEEGEKEVEVKQQRVEEKKVIKVETEVKVPLRLRIREWLVKVFYNWVY